MTATLEYLTRLTDRICEAHMRRAARRISESQQVFSQP